MTSSIAPSKARFAAPRERERERGREEEGGREEGRVKRMEGRGEMEGELHYLQSLRAVMQERVGRTGKEGKVGLMALLTFSPCRDALETDGVMDLVLLPEILPLDL